MAWTADPLAVLSTFAAAVVAIVLVVALVRAQGLLTFAKMAPHDFAATIAMGSLLATIATGAVPVARGVAALVGVLATQRTIQWWRRHGGAGVVDNTPLLLMADGVVLEENLRRARMAPGDLRAKLREHNVHDVEQVFAVVLETTGDVSVLHGDPATDRLDPSLLEGVRGTPAPQDAPPTWADGATP